MDRLDRLLSSLRNSYEYSFASGIGKQHGCAILYRNTLFTKIDQRIVYYDEERLNAQRHSDASFLTRNVALIVALQNKSLPEAHGLIVATTHLFWHPR
jgi:RNA exonuclease NGL2